MIDLDEINDEIARLEHGKTTYASCEKLSVLYTVRDKLMPPEAKEQRVSAREYSYAAAPESEFMQAVENAPLDGVFKIINDHMDAIKLVYPKEYSMIIRKINNLY